MSYDIYLRAEKCPHCGHEPEMPELPNPTYNLTPIFDLALTGEDLPNPATPEVAVVLLRHKTDRPRGLRLLSGRKAGETIADIEAALARMNDPAMRERFLDLQPSNGWGTIGGAFETFRAMLEAAREMPNAVWDIG